MPIANSTSPIPSTIGMTKRLLHPPDGEEQDHAERERGQPSLERHRAHQELDRAQVQLHTRGDVDAALEEQPSGAREEPPDDRIRDEPDQVAEPEGPEREEDGAAEDRHDQRRGDDGEEDVGDLARADGRGLADPRDVRGLGRRAQRHDARARPPPRPARCPRRRAARPPRQDPERRARPRRGTGRCRRPGGARAAPPNTKAANAIASTASTAPMIKPGGERATAAPGSSLLGHAPPFHLA